MHDCAACSLFQLESEGENCLHVNRPGGLELTREAVHLSGLQPGASFLEVASGAGTTLRYLRDEGFKALGLDLSYPMLKIARLRNPELPILQADCERIPLPSASQDAVLIECAFSLAADPAAMLRQFKRVLRPGGWLLVTDVCLREVNDPRAVDCLASTSCLSGVKQASSIRESVEHAGFDLRTWQDQTPLLKQWLARMVFQLGSLQAFYRGLVSCEDDAQSLSRALGTELKLGYYLMTAQKAKEWT